MEINQDQSNGKKQRMFILNLLWSESQPPSCGLGRDSKAGRGWESFVGVGGGLRCALREGCWPGEAVGGITRRRHSIGLAGRACFTLSDWS